MDAVNGAQSGWRLGTIPACVEGKGFTERVSVAGKCNAQICDMDFAVVINSTSRWMARGSPGQVAARHHGLADPRRAPLY